jgi:hypothetical protein
MPNPTDPTPPPALSSVKYSTGAPAAKTGNGSGWILAISILQFIGGLVMYGIGLSNSGANDAGPMAILVTTMGLAAIFFGLWLWGRKSPFPALLTALIVFVSFHLLEAVLDPMSILRGIIMKAIILAGLGSALKNAYVAKRQKELEAGTP